MSEDARILVIADGQATRESYRKALAGNGYHLDVVEDLLEALSRLARASFDLTILDLDLLEPISPELLEQIRQQHPDVAVVVATSSALSRSMIEDIEMGIDDFAIKPFTRDSLRFAVDLALEKKKLRRNNVIAAVTAVDADGFFW